MQTSAAKAPVEIGKPTFSKLAEAAHDPDTRTRREALIALAEFGPKGEEYLKEALCGSNPDIRAHAKKVFYILKHEADHPVARKAGMSGISDKSIAQGFPTSKKLPDLQPKKIIADPNECIARFVIPDRSIRMHATECLAKMG